MWTWRLREPARSFGTNAEIREIEALYLAAVVSTQQTLYIESQYLAARTLADALAKRLREADCPEVVLVLPRNAEGWLEQKAMDGARHRVLAAFALVGSQTRSLPRLLPRHQ